MSLPKHIRCNVNYQFRSRPFWYVVVVVVVVVVVAVVVVAVSVLFISHRLN